MIQILAKYNDGEPIDVRAVDTYTQGEYIAKLRNTGYLDFVMSEQPQCDAGFVAVDSYKVEDGKLVQSWAVVKDPQAVQSEIEALKKALAESDYKITKCYECSLVGDELPYNVQDFTGKDKKSVMQSTVLNAS